ALQSRSGSDRTTRARVHRSLSQRVGAAAPGEPRSVITAERALLRQIQTNQPIFASEIKLSVREDRRRPARIMQFGHLPATDFLRFFGIRLEEAEQASFAEHN